jgi:hypothetical protein
MRSDYQVVLAKVRAWAAEQTEHGFDVWAPRWQLADDVPGAMAGRSMLTDLYASQVLRALGVLVEEGALVKINSGRDARYMQPAVREREVAAAQEAGRRHAERVERYHSVRMGLAKAGFTSISTSQLDVRLELEDWERLISQYLDDGDN